MQLRNGIDGVWVLALVVATVITASYVGAVYLIESTFVPRDQFIEDHSGSVVVDSGAATTDSDVAIVDAELATVAAEAAAPEPAYLLAVECTARAENKFEFLDTSGLEEILIEELQQRTGRDVRLVGSDVLSADSLGQINVLVRVWKQSRMNEGPNDALSRARLPEHVAIDFDMDAEVGDRNWDGYHDLEVELPMPSTLGMRTIHQVRHDHLEEMVRRLLDQLPGNGRLNSSR